MFPGHSLARLVVMQPAPLVLVEQSPRSAEEKRKKYFYKRRKYMSKIIRDAIECVPVAKTTREISLVSATE
jgi:hypothetical protein